VAIGWLRWDAGYATIWTDQLGHKVAWGLGEIGFSAVILAGYWLWRKWGGDSTRQRVVRTMLLAATALNLLYHFPPLFFIAQRLDALHSSGEPVTSAEFRQMMGQHEIPALMVHFALASAAVAGLMLMGLGPRWLRRGRSPEEVGKLTRAGAVWTLAPTVAQLPVGLWVLVTLPREMQNKLLGYDAAGIICFGLAMAAAVWMARELMSVAAGETERARIVRAMIAMTATVVLMTAAHEITRG
jgi:hypothetical protein